MPAADHEPEEAEIAIDIGEGLVMAAITWGDAAAETRILCVHGWLDNAGSFGTAACAAQPDEAAAANGLGARLARAAGAYVVACDLIGHGRSTHQPGGLYSAAGWAVQLLKFSTLLGWDDRPCVLIGHSMGQEICSLLCASFPERFSSFVMLDGCGPWVMPTASTEGAEGAEQGEAAGWMAAHPADRLRSGVENFLKRDGHHSSPRSFADYETVIGARLRNKFSEAGISRHGAAALVRRGITTTVQPAALGAGASGDEDEVIIQYTHDPRVAMDGVTDSNGYTEEQVQQLLARVPPSLCVMAESGIGVAGEKRLSFFLPFSFSISS
jgi:pimeloyl-ACP methyl ester carboxylesterase|eukprot:COSAG06_NODE_9899_length_1794_cov_1.211799_1_plen_326_part_00